MFRRLRFASHKSEWLMVACMSAASWLGACSKDDAEDTTAGADSGATVATDGGSGSSEPNRPWPDPDFVPDTTGFSATGLDALHAGNEAQVDDEIVVGIATLLFKDGHVVDHHQYGMMDSEAGKPVATDTIYRIYSMTKPITGVAMMMLVESGDVSLDDLVTDYIPEFANMSALDGMDEDGNPIIVDAERPATLRELMSHTAGFGYGLFGNDPANAAFRDGKVLDLPSFDEFIGATAKIPLYQQPGKGWYYSAAVDIQGAIVERVSGETFGEFLHERLFEPLGMVDTHFVLPREDLDRLADVLAVDAASGNTVVQPYFRTDPTLVGDEPLFESGGGGLVSTLPDYARFCRMMVNEGELDGVRYLKAETVELMRTNVLESDQQVFGAQGVGFGLGVAMVTDPPGPTEVAPVGSYFWGGAAGTWFWIDPVNDLFFIGMVQNMQLGLNPYATKSRDLVYGALE